MARPLRIEFPGAFYHVMVRGNQKQTIFHDKQDRVKYLEIIERYKKQHSFLIYAYTLMINHVHLLIETPKTPISKIMQVINLTYTIYFNRKYKKVGHLFQGRYKSYLCDKDAYLLSLVRYVHLNPVRAKLVKTAKEYKWSSHQDYLYGSKGIVESDKFLRLFSEKTSDARRLYKAFMDESIDSIDNGDISQAVDQQILGDDQFIEKVEKEIETLHTPLKRPPLKKIFSLVAELTGVTQEEIKSRSRNNRLMFARFILVGVCRETGYRLVDIQPELQRDLSVLSRWSVASGSKEGQRRVQEVLKYLNARLQA